MPEQLSDDARAWRESGSKAVSLLLSDRRWNVEDALATLEDDLRTGESIDPADVETARLRINELQRAVEEYVAPAAGVDPWERPPEATYGQMKAWTMPEGESDE